MFFVIFKNDEGEYDALNDIFSSIETALLSAEAIEGERLPLVVAAILGKLPDGKFYPAPLSDEISDMCEENRELRDKLNISEGLDFVLAPGPQEVN